MSGNFHWTAGHLTKYRQRSANIVAASVVVALGVLSTDASAQQWLFVPEIEIGAEHVDNPRLNEGNVATDAITGGVLGVAAEMRRNTEISSILIRPAANIFRYSGDSDEDSESYFLDFEATRQGQRSDWGFTANYSQQQVLRGETTSSEIDEPDVIDDDQTGTGRTFERRERDLLRLRPRVSFDITERTALSLTFNYLDNQYDAQEVGEAVNYTNSRVDASIVRALTEDSSLAFGVFASRYDSESADRDTESVGAGVRYQKDVTEISSFFVDVGALDSDLPSSTNPGTDVSESSFLWNIGYIRHLERTRWILSAGQAVTPSGSGFLVERDLYRVAVQHRLRPRWLTEFSAVLQNTDALTEENVISTVDRDYAQLRASLGYELTRKFTLEGSYNFTHQDFADTPGDAQEHEFRVSLIYRPPTPTQ